MKKSNLASNFQQSLEREKQKAEPTETATSKSTQPSRQKKKSINAFVHPAVVKELKLLSVETGKTQQDLFIEAINDLLEKYHKTGIA